MAQSKRQQRWWRRTNAGLAVLIAFLLALPVARADTADSGEVQLQLDVRVNGYPLNLVAAFVQMPDGKIASPRSELTELGVAVPGDGAPEELIVLDTLTSLSYVYDESAQSIELELPNAARLAKNLDATGGQEFTKAESGSGLVLNYTGYASADYNLPDARAAVDGASLSLDARAFSKFGTLRQTAILGTTTFSDFTALRLDSTWSFSDQQSMRTYRIGDIVSGGLSWTRPVRIGGAQVQRNFGLRPDLITMPLPLIEGSAEVPSTLKVFIGETQAYSNHLQPGPFRIDSLPVYTSSGTARVVLTDSTGRQVESEQEFYTSPDLLKTDLYDFSLEAGVVRRDFGTGSFGYDDAPVALASLRYGIADILTGEAHAEANADLIDIGIGALLSGGRFGMFSAAVAGSLHDGDAGIFLRAGWEGRFGDFGVNLSSSRTFGEFFDLAAATEKPVDGKSPVGGVPRELDQISFNYTFRELKSGVGLSFVHQLDNAGIRSLILTGSYSQSFDNDITAFVSGFADFGDSREYGAFVGFSMPFGKTISTSAGASVTKEGWTAVAEASRPSGGTPGSYGWRVSHGEGGQRYTAASAAYRGTKASVDGHIVQQDEAVNANVDISGAAVLAGGGLFLGNQISDSFAVVDAGAPDVTVEYENRFAGKTDASGKLLLPDLRSYQKNKIAIDVTNLPLNAAIPESEAIVVPREMSGVVVDFGVKAESSGALVILTDSKGGYITESAEVFLEGASEPFVMGYDGQVYLTGLGAQNNVTVKAGGNQCQANFSYKPDDQNQTTIGPLQCL
jgi:outer membrane usher protein